ncbi:MAG: zinc-dependent metalloprotease [Actinomycetota bacterium]|nr:zinc-dependent metalloprotease [Actinomycetota bacterium]
MVDWSLARQIARFAAGSEGSASCSPARPPLTLCQQVRDAEREVSRYTGLAVAGKAPGPELIDRAGWAEINLDSLSRLLDPVADRLNQRLEAAGPLAGALRMGAGATLAAEAGLVMGYLSKRVLGQYELSLLAPDVPPRLLFVTPNLERVARDMDVDRESFEGWVAAHEVTHVLQFGGVPWLRRHLGDLVREYLETVDVRIERDSAGALPRLPHPRALVERFAEGGLAALVQTRTQRSLMSRLQAVMAVVEGYSEHVMDAVAPSLVSEPGDLRAAMERRRGTRSPPERVLGRLLGLDLKLRQYEHGRRFCNRVVQAHGIDGLNRVWEEPEALPSLGELARPEDWAERVAGASLASA